MSCVLQFLVGADVMWTGRAGPAGRAGGWRGSRPPARRRASRPSGVPGEMLGVAPRAPNTPAWGAGAPRGRVPGGPDRAPGLVGPRRPSLRPPAAARSQRPWPDNPRRSGRVRAQGCQTWWPLLVTLLRRASALRTGSSVRRGCLVAADVDPPPGEPRGEPGVLALLADGEGELEVGYDDAGRARGQVDDLHRRSPAPATGRARRAPRGPRPSRRCRSSRRAARSSRCAPAGPSGRCRRPWR